MRRTSQGGQTVILDAIQFPNLNPAALTLPGFSIGGMHLGPFPLRWYALAYIAGLLLGWRWMVYLIRKERLWKPGKAPLTVPQADDFLFWATLGVIVGGRLGYVLFYMLPDPESRARIAHDVFTIVRIWDGGMSFHGGLIGVCLAAYYFCRQQKIALLGLGDLAAAATPIGLFFGRIANFVNGELWGRPTHAPWGVVFCNERIAETNGGCPAGMEPRHPSQLYEATLEGLLLFAIINTLTLRFESLRKPGLNTGVFLVCYGLFRASLEFVREPDRQMPDFLRGYVTMGMLLSTPMILLGLWLIRRAYQLKPAAA
ncbi:MAG TPA: prolipoprotein diacylglyceryl transferase [Caulobacterales bacterium]|nr:prolipoprotein diacylglyceryl transferase [Caulobacterales bacterium]